MSSSEEDERKEYVKREPGAAVNTIVTRPATGTTQVVASPAPAVEKESVVKHTSTNNTALVGLAVGIVVLVMGLLLVIRYSPALPYPWSLISFLAIGIGLIAMGGSLISNRTTER